MSEVMRWGHRSGSAFWTVLRKFVTELDPASADPWISRFVWWDVFPLGWDLPKSGPGPMLRGVQRPFVGQLFWEALDYVQARQVVLVSGRSWWPDIRELLGLQHLAPASLPIIATGEAHDRRVVAAYHPRGARQQRLRDGVIVGAVVEALRSEGPTSQ